MSGHPSHSPDAPAAVAPATPVADARRRKARPFVRRNALAQHDLHYGPNMTPMVDVVMVILVFFMASAVFLGPEWFLRTAIPIIRPGAAAPQSAEKKTLRIRLTNESGESRAAIEASGSTPASSPMPLDQLQTLLANESKAFGPANLTIAVLPTPEAPYESVVAVHEFCQKLGITRVAIVDEAIEKAPPVEPEAPAPAPPP